MVKDKPNCITTSSTVLKLIKYPQIIEQMFQEKNTVGIVNRY